MRIAPWFFYARKGICRGKMKERRYSGPSFAALLSIAFILLKLCGVIGWKWVWVVSPLWIVLAIYLLLALVIALANG